MRKITKITIITLITLLVLLIGFKMGEYAVIYNQDIYNADGSQGVYYSEYNGTINKYWHEQGGYYEKI